MYWRLPPAPLHSSAGGSPVGRIVAPVLIANALDSAREIRCKILVDAGTAGLVLPTAWRSRLGPPPTVRTVEMETAGQRVVTGGVCGPVGVQVEGFDKILNEVTFLEMQPRNGEDGPPLGHLLRQ